MNSGKDTTYMEKLNIMDGTISNSFGLDVL